MSAPQMGLVMRLLGWLVIAAVATGLSLDGRVVVPGPLALVAAALLVPLVVATSLPAVRAWLGAAAVASLLYAACVGAPWVTDADPMGMLRASQVVAGLGFACYCRGLSVWVREAGWTQPARQLRWCAGFFVAVAAVVAAALVALVASTEPVRGADAPTGLDVVFERPLPDVGSVPIAVLAVVAVVALAATLAALAAMSTMSTLNRQLSRYLLGTGPAPDVLAVPESGSAPSP